MKNKGTVYKVMLTFHVVDISCRDISCRDISCHAEFISASTLQIVCEIPNARVQTS